RAEESVLRTRILPGLLRAVAANHAQGLPNVTLFEQGRVFAAPRAGEGLLPVEPELLAVAFAGTLRRAPVEPDRARDAYDAVDAVRAVCDALELAEVVFEPDLVPGMHRRRAARVVVLVR